MELNDLKQIWQNQPIKNKSNIDIMALIQHKGHGPLTALKATFRKQMIAMAFLPAVLVALNIQDLHKVFTSIIFWSYIAFCVCTVLFARYNYRIVKRMHVMDGMVKSNLAKQIALLEKRANLELMYLRGVLFFFVILVELVPYVQHYRMLDLWHSLPLWVRFSSYGCLFLLQFFLNRRLKEIRVGRHLANLKELISQMQ